MTLYNSTKLAFFFPFGFNPLGNDFVLYKFNNCHIWMFNPSHYQKKKKKTRDLTQGIIAMLDWILA
jgi:hypothetical protein